MDFSKLFHVRKIETKSGFFKNEINILGFRICHHTYKISKIFSASEKLNRKYNANLIYTPYHFLLTAHDEDLFCLRHCTVCFIFNKKVLDFGYKNFRDYILNGHCACSDVLEFSELDKTSVLYKEHQLRLKNNEFLWKYRDTGFIIHQFLSFDEKGFYVHDTILEADNQTASFGCDNIVFHAKNSCRPFYNGVTVKEYLEDKDYNTQKIILIKLIEHIFKDYTIENGAIDGKLFDCHLGNFIYDDYKQFHLIDDDLISKTPLNKDYIIKRLLDNKATQMTNELLVHFGFSPIPLKKDTTHSKLYKTEQLRQKYFSKY